MQPTNRHWFIGFISACALATPLLAGEDARAISAEERFAEALVETRTEEERAALLAKDAELITAVLWKALIAQGDRIRWRSDYPRALAVYALAQTVAEKIGDKLGIAQALNGTGVVHQLQSNYPLALEYHGKSLALSEEVGDKAGIASSLTNFGLINGLQGNYALALEYHRKSLKLREEVGDKTTLASTLLNIANIFYFQGDYDPALRNYRSALEQFELAGDKVRSGVALNNIGSVYLDRGNYAEALQYFQKSMALREAAGHKEGLVSTLDNIGNTYFYQGNYRLALKHYQEGLTLAEELGDKGRAALLLHRIGGVHRAQGDYNLALEFYGKSRTQREALGEKAGVAETLNEIGNVYRLQNKLGLALEYSRKSLALHEKLGGKSGMAEALRNLALVQHSLGEHAPAVETSARAAAIARQIGARETLWNALTTRGRAYRALDRTAEARQSFEEAITTIEEMRGEVAGGEQEQQRSFEKKISPYQAMVELLVAQNEPGPALAYAERAKARVLLDVLRSGRVDITKAMTQPEREQEGRLRNDLVSCNAQLSREKQRERPDETRVADFSARLQKARLDYEAFVEGLYAAHPQLKSQRAEMKPVSLDETSALLSDATSALLEYVVSEEATYLFVLTKEADAARDTFKVYTLTVKPKELTARVEQLRGQLARRDLAFRTQARELHDLLLGPAREQLRGRTSLIIVPDAVLWELPFQTLRSTENRYLLEDFAISYAPSLTVLREMVELRRKRIDRTSVPANLLAVGNPALGAENKKLTALPEAEHEVRTLGELYGTTRSTIYVGAEAREDRVKTEAGRFGIVHLATHGILNDASPMYSQVVLSQATESPSEDGLLEAWEIMKLDLRADLVVLSSCETGRGRIGAGEGMIGLTWAFFVAGCPTTVVSQWKVESASTTALMVEFHRQLRSGASDAPSRVGAAEALRRAALQQMRSDDYWHPFYWASFVAIGGAAVAATPSSPEVPAAPSPRVSVVR